MENTEQLPMDGDNKAGWVNGTGEYKKKKQRNKTKGLQRKIKNQMELYFSKLNQYKFMKQHLDNAPDGYLPLFLFLKFAEILKLTSSTEVIAKALKTSRLLEISKDKTKVRRTQLVHHLTEEEADQKTVYVDGLPPTANHNWIAQCFSSCGKVKFVSLPRHESTGDIKGFAFVEFATRVEAANAIKKMNVSGLPCGERQEIGASRSTTEHKKSDQKMKKDCPKKSKSEASDKIKKMSAKDGKMNKQKQGERNKLKKEPPRLRVMSKHEWSRLRYQYLNQQRASMASHKQPQHSICSNVAQGTKHGMVSVDAGHQKSGPSLLSAPKFQPSVIVEIKSEAPMSHKQLKQQIQSDIKVAYIDVKDNMLHGYIRCKDAESAQKLVASNLTGCMLHLVQGKEERKYWNKMQLDRMSKWANSKRPKKKGSAKTLEKVKSFMVQAMKKSHILLEEDCSERQAERHDEDNGFKAQKMNHSPKSEGELHKVANIKPSKKQALKDGIDPEKKDQDNNSVHATNYKSSKTNAEKERRSKKKEQKHTTTDLGTEKSEHSLKRVKRCDGKNSENSENVSELPCNERQEVGTSRSTAKQKTSDKEIKEHNAEKKKLKVKQATKKSSEPPAFKEADGRKGKRKSTDRTEADSAKKSKGEASDKMEEVNVKEGKTRKKLKNDPSSLRVMSNVASHKQPLHSICSNVVQGTEHGMVSVDAVDQKSDPSLRSAFLCQSNVIVEIKSEGPMSHKQLEILEIVKNFMLQSMKKSHILFEDGCSEQQAERHDEENGFKAQASTLPSSKMNHSPKSEGELHKVANIKPSKKQAHKDGIDPEKKDQDNNSVHATNYKSSKTNAEKERRSKKEQKHTATDLGTENSEHFLKRVKRCDGKNPENSENVSELPCNERQEVSTSRSTAKQNTSDKEIKEHNAEKKKLKVKQDTKKSSEPPAFKEADGRKGKRKSTDRTEADSAKKSKGHQKSVPSLLSAPKFQPNVIVEIKSEGPMSHKELKQRIQSAIQVAYIDVKDNMLHGYIRCKDADSAQKLVASNLTGCMLHLVQGKEEKKYWSKMQLDRMSKWASSKRQKKKGASKILEKVKNFMLQSTKKSHFLLEEDCSERQAERHDEENGFKA